MPHLTRRLPKYRKHKPSGQAVVTLSGKDHYLGPHGTRASKLEYDRLIAEWLASGRRLPKADADDAGLSIAELLVTYVRHLDTSYANAKDPRSVPARTKAALRPLKLLYGREPAADFGPLKLKVVRQQYVDGGLARKTVNVNTGFVKRLFKWAVSEELVPPDVFHGLQAVEGLRAGQSVAKESKKVRPVEPESLAATLPCLPATVRAMVELQLLLGCRPGELCDMRPGDIDRSETVWVYRPQDHKTAHHGHEREIPIGPRAQEILLPYLLRPADAYCFQPAESERARNTQRHASRRVPLNQGNKPGSRGPRNRKRPPGDRYTNDTYRRAVERACDKAKVERWTPHRLRHSRATEVRKHFGLEGAQVVLGHANANVTQIYAARNLDLAKQVALQLG